IQNNIWRPQTIFIEYKVSGISLLQTLTTAGLNVEGMKADVNKRARATKDVKGASAGSVQGWYRMGRVYHPETAEWLTPFEKELKDFVGDDSGKDDQVDAVVHLVTAAIRLGAGAVILPTGYEKMSLPSSEGPVQDLFSTMMANVVNPFAALSCKDCDNYEARAQFCRVHNRRVMPMDLCDQFSSGLAVIN
ncbi:MAG: phage terminase large subunit family protein, partial [Sulfobacillus sp.]